MGASVVRLALEGGAGERPFTKSTLQLFRAQLLVHPQMRLAFERSLELAKKTEADLGGHPACGQGAGQGEEAETPGLRPQPGLGRHFGSSIKGENEVDWEDDDSRSRFLAELVADAHRALRLACEVGSKLEARSPGRFEVIPERIDAAFICIDRLIALGNYEFNYDRAESQSLVLPAWMEDRSFRPVLQNLYVCGRIRSGWPQGQVRRKKGGRRPSWQPQADRDAGAGRASRR